MLCGRQIYGLQGFMGLRAMTKPSKYRNCPVVVDGMRFASSAEAGRYRILKMLQQAGEISDLQCQVPFALAPAVHLFGAKRKTPALRYLADFTYRNKIGQQVIEDVKGGPLTQAYRIKRHLLALKGIHITEIRT